MGSGRHYPRRPAHRPVQSDIGSATGKHLHFEVAAIPAGTSPPFSQLGGFISNGSWNRVTVVCFSDGDDNGDSLYTDGESTPRARV